MPKPEKVQAVESLTKALEGSRGVVLADFKGLSVADLQGLRRKVRQEGGTAQVMKNTLIKLALDASKIPGMEPFLKDNTILFSSREDVLKVLKILSDYSKENAKFALKAGFIDGQVLDTAGVKAMAGLPSRKELLGMIAGNLNGVIANFVGTLSGMIQQLVGTVEAIEKKKSA